MIVKREHRKQGVGQAIIDHLLTYAAGRGFTEFSIGVDVANVAARRLYEKLGFTEVIFHGYDNEGEYVKLLKRQAR